MNVYCVLLTVFIRGSLSAEGITSFNDLQENQHKSLLYAHEKAFALFELM